MDNQYYTKEVSEYAKNHAVIAAALSNTPPNGQRYLHELFTFASENGDLENDSFLDYCLHRYHGNDLIQALCRFTAELLQSKLYLSEIDTGGDALMVNFEGENAFFNWEFTLHNLVSNETFRFYNLQTLEKSLKRMGFDFPCEIINYDFEPISNSFRMADYIINENLWHKIVESLKDSPDFDHYEFTKNTSNYSIFNHFMQISKKPEFADEPFVENILIAAFSKSVEPFIVQDMIDRVKENPELVNAESYYLDYQTAREWIDNAAERWTPPMILLHTHTIQIGKTILNSDATIDKILDTMRESADGLRQMAQKEYNDEMNPEITEQAQTLIKSSNLQRKP